MEGVPSAHPQHLQHLLDFVDTQAAFYLKCHESLMSLQSDLSGQVKKFQLIHSVYTSIINSIYLANCR